ncbi:hypothetical protein B0H13DRAFT_2338281 [Mycena leptocephala]|nr:hypothetical protein B0H13DRAFT_2338281 [Mycena leptocephala]
MHAISVFAPIQSPSFFHARPSRRYPPHARLHKERREADENNTHPHPINDFHLQAFSSLSFPGRTAFLDVSPARRAPQQEGEQKRAPPRNGEFLSTLRSRESVSLLKYYRQRSPKGQSVPGHLRTPAVDDVGTKATEQNDGDDRTIAALGRFRVNDPRTERRTGGRERVRLSASRRLRLPAVDNATPHADPILLEQAEVCAREEEAAREQLSWVLEVGGAAHRRNKRKRRWSVGETTSGVKADMEEIPRPQPRVLSLLYRQHARTWVWIE